MTDREEFEQPTTEQSSLVQEPMIIKTENGMTLKLGYDELPNGTAFYTTPPSREWVGLSDVEVQKVLKEMWDKGTIPSYSIVKFASAIEAKLREKNNGT